jgi:hypothetical protein
MDKATALVYFDLFKNTTVEDLNTTETEPKKVGDYLRESVELGIGDMVEMNLAYKYAMEFLKGVNWQEIATQIIEQSKEN